MAFGQNHAMAAYVEGGQLRWLDLGEAEARRTEVRAEGGGLRASFECRDRDGALWRFEQRFSRGQLPSSIDVRSEVTLDQARSIAFLPMWVIFPGVGGFGTNKGQGLLAGLEYLENEPSSSEADVVGPASRRQVPDNAKLTFPLMAIQEGERYLGVTWQMRPQFSAVFDSPDRLFNSGGHVMGLLFPGSDGKNRVEGSLLPVRAETLQAGQTLTLRATVLGGAGKSIVPAVQQYVALRGLPARPPAGMDLQGYVRQTAGGWLDSKIRETNRFHHAIAGGNFPLNHAADAAVWMDWLSRESQDAALSSRLNETAKTALEGIPPEELNVSGVGHVRYPVASLLYGHVAETTAQAERSGRGLLGRFEPDLSVKYHRRENEPDYARTHWSQEATGLASRPVEDLLEAAAFCGDRELLEAGLERLRAMNKFDETVPRGAQTWECPLHTPDILASAQMVRAYTLGYELTGENEFLQRAKYWAWTGVPFVYLVNPTPQPVGLYSTIAVFGATQWKAPVWLGLPVQWCGLVYADALYRLERHDPAGPWKKLADGITASGIEQSWPAADADTQGLLPDSFVLRSQHRNGPAINPATVQACAVRLFGQTPIYDFWSFPKKGVRVHAPGKIESAGETAAGVRFKVDTGLKQPYFVLINGLNRKPKLRLDGKDVDCAAPHEFLENSGRLILRLEKNSEVEIMF